MYKSKSFFYVLVGFLMLLSLPVQAWDCCGPLDITAEARVAYYHPSSKRVRRIYGDGWADYQFELSKGFKGFGFFGGSGGCGDACGCTDPCTPCCQDSCCPDWTWRLWVGVSGFSRKGDSIHFHDRTRLELIPVNFGIKLVYPIFCNTSIFIGGAACYSFLRIRDHSEFVHKHTRREEWGGLFQSGICYNYCDWLVVSAFFDYFFQRFDFHDKHRHSYYNSGYFQDSRFIERHNLNLNGYKIGVGLGVTF